MHIDGGCHCGSIRYEAEINPDNVRLCHCTDCQVMSGSAFRVVVQAPRAGFKLLKGTPKTYVKTAESGNKRVQAFCADCGTSLYAAPAVDDPPTYGLRVGTIRQRAQLKPARQIWCRSKLGWVPDFPDMPASPGQPPA